MSQEDIHVLLEDSRINAEALVAEMGKYRTSRELHQAETDALNEVNEGLEETLKRIRPFRDVQMRRFQIIVIAGTALNSLLLIIILLALILKTG